VADMAEISDKMAELQKMRVALILTTSAETSKLLSRRQRVSGKEIEVMCAERDMATGADGQLLDTLRAEEARLRSAMEETEQDITKLEELLAQVNADISALCQA
jgi:DNA transposition AAA+ family ATPase